MIAAAPWRSWVHAHYDLVAWVFLADLLLIALLIAWAFGRWSGRRECEQGHGRVEVL